MIIQINPCFYLKKPRKIRPTDSNTHIALLSSHPGGRPPQSWRPRPPRGAPGSTRRAKRFNRSNGSSISPPAGPTSPWTSYPGQRPTWAQPAAAQHSPWCHPPYSATWPNSSTAQQCWPEQPRDNRGLLGPTPSSHIGHWTPAVAPQGLPLPAEEMVPTAQPSTWPKPMDLSALVSHFDSLTLWQIPTDWYFDSGVTSHRISSPGTLEHGRQLYSTAINDLIAYSDADWAGCLDYYRSTSDFYVFLGPNLISWSLKHQHTISCSSAEAEYHGVANVVAETCWLQQLLRELHYPLPKATIVYCDNISAVYLSTNSVQHQWRKHVEIDLHFVREKVTLGKLRVLHVPSSHHYADIFTKGLPTPLFCDFWTSLSVCAPPTTTVGAC